MVLRHWLRTRLEIQAVVNVEPPLSVMCLHHNPGQPSALLPEINNFADALLKGQCHVNRNVFHGRRRF